ncbi:hypothetical protein [Pseudomonas kurunegalensis]|uniref:hypothetical protein n=1 Tax=Pseudomonas kurunegalensis TaxID=485880 RepID=UPI00355904DC
MFRTIESHRVGVPGMFGEGESMWYAVTRYMETHYFHLTIALNGGERRGRYLMKLDDERLLQRVLVSQSDEAYVKSIRVVTPGHINGTGDWLMEPLARAVVGQDRNECSVSVLTVESGQVYHTSQAERFEVEDLVEETLIFLPSMIRPS